MPNWCLNRVTFKHESPKMIERVINGVESEKLFEEFAPNPNQKGDNWYAYNVAEWGTKWDAGGQISEQGENFVTAIIDTAWSPPIEFYRKMTDLGFQVEAFYYEPGMLFCGKYTSEDDEEHFEMQNDLDWVLENIPTDIDDAMGISDDIMSMMEEEEDE